MGAPAVQHHVPKHPRNISGLVPFLFTLATYSYVWITNLVLVIPLCTAFPLYFPFQSRDQLDDQSVLLSPPFLPVCTKSDVHTKFPPFISCLNQVQDSTP